MWLYLTCYTPVLLVCYVLCGYVSHTGYVYSQLCSADHQLRRPPPPSYTQHIKLVCLKIWCKINIYWIPTPKGQQHETDRQDNPHACGTRQSPCMWGKTIPMHAGQDNPHACGARQSPCMWDKTIPMHVGQDNLHACGARQSPCMRGKTIPMHAGQDNPHACGTRQSPCMWDKTIPMHAGQDNPHACGARQSPCMWSKTVPCLVP